MSILSTDLIAYCAASRPTDDVSTTGGAIDTTVRASFTQFSASAKVSLTSNAADTRNVTITGRDATGAFISETVALNGVTEVLSTNTYERVLSVIAASTNTNTVTVKQGSGGTTIATIPANEKGFAAFFVNSVSAGTQQVRYEKLFWKNTNGTLTLTSSTVTLTADPAAKIFIGVEAALNDTNTITNRLAVPAGVTFVDDNISQNVPNSQNLTAGSAIGVWIRQTLAINDAAVKSTFTTQLAGNTV